MAKRIGFVVAVFAALVLAACNDSTTLPSEQGFGANPNLPEPGAQSIPTIKIAEPDPWAENEAPVAAEGFALTAFARGLDHPRWLYVLPNGDVLVAESNKQPGEGGGFMQMIADMLMSRAGGRVPSADRITLLRDTNGDGVADMRSVFLQGLRSPFGMALVGQDFYVANTDAVVRFPYVEGETSISAQPTTVLALPANEPNNHWTRNIIASRDGARLYVTVGSNSNIAEGGIEAEEGRAAIWEIDRATGTSRLFATGLRNPNGLAWEPISGALWTTVNERDQLGNDLVPDYMTSVRDGGFYGWPYSYFGQNVDARVEPQRPDLVATAIAPDYALGAHTASLGLAFYESEALPQDYWGGAFIGQHGSWNRSEYNGYQVVFVPFSEGRPDGAPEIVLAGFIDAEGRAKGRPAGVAIDARGGVLVADDVGNVVWRLSSSAAPPLPAAPAPN